MDSVNDRLKRLRERCGLSVRGLAQDLEMPSSTYAAYEDPKKFKKRFLPLSLAERLAPILEGHGALREEVLALAGIDTAGALAIAPEDMAHKLDAVLLPEVQVSFSMGGGAVVDEWPVIQMVPFSRAWLAGLTQSPAHDLIVARGEGDSMMPTILDRDLVIIDQGQKIPRQQDRIWTLSYGGLGMIKRVRQLPDGSLEINSDNKDVTPIHAVEGEVTIVGRVVGIVRRI